MIKINKNLIFSNNKKPILIAEISGNHGGNKKKFLKLIKSAYSNGADLVKIQTYEADDITLNNRTEKFKINTGIWKNKYLWDLYKKACTPYDWHHDAFKIAKQFKKVLFSSPFSIRAVDFLEKFNMPIYKIASFEITDYKLVDYIASKKKPIIISTGVASLKDINKAIKLINQYHNKVIIMHCVSNYPTKVEDTNLSNIEILKKKFQKNLIGISDHTDNIYSSLASISLNVAVIEKHFKIDNKKTLDSDFSILPSQLKILKNNIISIHKSFKKKNNSSSNTKHRRSIFANSNIRKGERITENNIVSLRPKIGVCSSNYFKILNKKIKKNVKKGDPIFKNIISNF